MKDYSNEPDPIFPKEIEGEWPDGIPPTIAAGNYLCQIAGNPKKRTSQFPGQDFYYEIPLKVKDATGKYSDTKFSFSNPKNQIYVAILKVLGGKELSNRVVKPPPKTSIIGKLFMAQILERPMKNDKTKLANEIFRVWPHVPKKKTEPEPGAQTQIETEESNAETKPIEKEFPKSEEEEIPF